MEEVFVQKNNYVCKNFELKFIWCIFPARQISPSFDFSISRQLKYRQGNLYCSLDFKKSFNIFFIKIQLTIVPYGVCILYEFACKKSILMLLYTHFVLAFLSLTIILFQGLQFLFDALQNIKGYNNKEKKKKKNSSSSIRN